ncbi:MAG: hypothetical protein U1F50_01160 [Rubrivivax sp.]
MTNLASSFVVSLDAPATQAQTVTPSCSGATVSPATLTIPVGQKSVSFTVNPPSAGSYTVDFSISSGLKRVGTPHPLSVTSGATYLARQAALLAPGQCIRLDTGLTNDMVTLDGSDFLQWGISMYRDPVRREIGYIGKRDGPNVFHWAVYSEASNTWSNSRPLWSTDIVSGHGYDHNTCDPATGDVYHVPFGSNVVRRWNGTWSTLPGWSQNTTATGGLTWFPGLGLFYNDGFGLLHWNGSTWTTRFALGNGSYHDFSEYNDSADVLIFGGGNGSGYYKMTRGLAVTPIAAPPGFAIGANPNSQGIAVSDPNSATLIARSSPTDVWAAYNINAGSWSVLAQSPGSGPPRGRPPRAPDTNNAPLCCAIEDMGVMMFVQHRGGAGSTPAEVWLYRHS